MHRSWRSIQITYPGISCLWINLCCCSSHKTITYICLGNCIICYLLSSNLTILNCSCINRAICQFACSYWIWCKAISSDRISSCYITIRNRSIIYICWSNWLILYLTTVYSILTYSISLYPCISTYNCCSIYIKSSLCPNPSFCLKISSLIHCCNRLYSICSPRPSSSGSPTHVWFNCIISYWTILVLSSISHMYLIQIIIPKTYPISNSWIYIQICYMRIIYKFTVSYTVCCKIIRCKTVIIYLTCSYCSCLDSICSDCICCYLWVCYRICW